MMRKTKTCFAAVLAGILLFSFTACGRTPSVDTAEDTQTQTETGAGMPMQDDGATGGQTGGQQGNSQAENGQNAQNNDQNAVEDAEPAPLDPEPVNSVNSAEDAVRFISNNLYSLCSEVLPMAVETRALDLSDADAVQYNTGLSATDGITDIVLSESAVGSFAYSLVYVRTDGTNTDAIHQSLKDSIDPRKWVCVEAEAMNTVRLDNDILLLMGSAEQVDTISNSLTGAAQGVFSSVGEVNRIL